MSCGTENVKLEPMYVYMGTTQVQKQTITCLGDTADSLDGKYAFFYDSSAAKHYFWFNTSGGSAVDPAISGYTAHVVALTTGATSSAVATALAAVLDAVSGFDAAAVGNVVTLTATATGYAVLAHDAQATGGKTGFAFALTQVGDTYESVGLIEGDIAVSNLGRSAPVEIKSHQSGAQVLGQISSGGGSPELSFNLLEVTTSAYEKVLRYSSGDYLPVGGTNKLIGGGSLGQFTSPQYCKVVLHPTRLQVADKSSDYAFWKCTVDLSQVSFSGEKLLTLPVKIKAFKDCDKPAAIDTWSYGDWSQSLT